MSFINLPCTQCGAPLTISKGSVVQCFACGTTNVYVESYEVLSHFVTTLFGIPRAIEEIESQINLTQINERMLEIDKNFNSLLAESRNLELVLVSKLDNIDNKQKYLDLGQKIGHLAIVINNYLLPHLENSFQKEQYEEMKGLCIIRNAMLTALWMTSKAHDTFEMEETKKWYNESRSNFHRAKDLAIKFSKQSAFGFEDEKILAGAGERFSELLHDFITNNPAYYAEELEQIETDLKDLTDPRAIHLKKQIIQFYDLGTSMMFIMDELRNQIPLKELTLIRERILFYTQEIKENFKHCKKWLVEIENKFDSYQKKLMRLHCGQRIPYLDDYLKEFQKRHAEVINYYNDMISQYVSASLADFALEVADNFELLDVLVDDLKHDQDEIVDKFDKEHMELLVLEESLKSFLYDFWKEAINEDLSQTHTVDLVHSTSEKHADYDKRVLRYINSLIEDFIEVRNSKALTLEEQKNLFNLSYLPKIEKLIRTSFTLKLDEIPLPLFIELLFLASNLDVDSDNRLVILLENPSSITLKNVGVSFFVPNSFRIKTRIIDVGKLRSNQKLKVDTNFIPTKEGRFYLMAMVNYTHTKESFWMPSIKIPIIVGNPDKQDELLLELYKKYGIDPEVVEMIKSLEENSAKSGKKFSKSLRSKFSSDTIEKQEILQFIDELESLESDDKEED